jgi:hypothetical protein
VERIHSGLDVVNHNDSPTHPLPRRNIDVASWHALLKRTARLRIVLSGLALTGALVVRSARMVPSGKTFPSADAAAQALISAAAADDVNGILEILGPSAKNLMSSNAAADKKIRHDFAANAAHKTKLVVHQGRQDERMLLTGENEWPLPIPIVKINGKWHFATSRPRDHE